MRISDWSSDVCSSELVEAEERRRPETGADVTRSNVAAAMLRDRQLVIARLQRLGADVIEVPADAMGASAVEAYLRSEERRVGKECVSPCKSRWSTYH